MATYSTLAKVKSILRTWTNIQGGGARIDFSEAYVDLRPGANNSTQVTPIFLELVDFDDSWYGIAEFRIEFTSSTAFTAYIKPDGNSVEYPIGSGDTSALFTAVNPIDSNTIFTLAASYWSGTAAVGDEILWRSLAMFSNDVAENFLLEAQTCVDTWALSHPSRKIQTVNSNGLVFPNSAHYPITGAITPNQVVLATEYTGAFLVWSAAYPTPDLSKSQVFQWWVKSRNYINRLIEAIPIRMAQVVSHQPIIPISQTDKIGSPVFGFGNYKRQGIEITLLDVESRLRNWTLDPVTIGYTSSATNFP